MEPEFHPGKGKNYTIIKFLYFFSGLSVSKTTYQMISYYKYLLEHDFQVD